jgi:Protein of unknown function (DUF3631)
MITADDVRAWDEKYHGNGEEPTPLNDAARLLRRYVAAHKHVTHVGAVWVAHGYAIDDFWTTPRLIVESPEPECGKTMFLDVLGYELDDPVQDVSITSAALVRTLVKRTPAFLLDECDKHIGRDDAMQSETLSLPLAVANAGYRRGKTVTRCVGNNQEPTKFPTFAPMAFAGLNSKLDRAFRTRAISLWLDRAQPRREFEWNEELSAEFSSLRARLRAWADTHSAQIKAARPARPAWMKGRYAEIWVPLLKIAEVAGGPWPRRILDAANELSGKVSGSRGRPCHHHLAHWGDPNSAHPRIGGAGTDLSATASRLYMRRSRKPPSPYRPVGLAITRLSGTGIALRGQKRSIPLPYWRQQSADEPEQWQEEADDEHDPVALPDRDDPEGDQQDEVQDDADATNPELHDRHLPFVFVTH